SGTGGGWGKEEEEEMEEEGGNRDGEGVLGQDLFPRGKDHLPRILTPETGELSARVQGLLDLYIPSRLYQRLLVPQALRGDFPAGDKDWLAHMGGVGLCNEGKGLPLPRYRALLMPSRRYFSFVREGRVLVRVLSKFAAATSDGRERSPFEIREKYFWGLCFRRSVFTGEFTQSLLQALHRSPLVQHLSFTGITPDENANLGFLARSLPPWLKTVVFDNALSPQ
ncbi:unnamed protein product, partial [Discosporangium mesarthrocarpum]